MVNAMDIADDVCVWLGWRCGVVYPNNGYHHANKKFYLVLGNIDLYIHCYLWLIVLFYFPNPDLRRLKRQDNIA